MSISVAEINGDSGDSDDIQDTWVFETAEAIAELRESRKFSDVLEV